MTNLIPWACLAILFFFLFYAFKIYHDRTRAESWSSDRPEVPLLSDRKSFNISDRPATIQPRERSREPKTKFQPSHTRHENEYQMRIGGFLPKSRRFREIYGTVIPSYQLEANWNLVNHLKIWGNISYSNVSGHSVPLRTRTKLQMVPISLGLAYAFPLPKSFEMSVGAGACYTWLKETNHSEFIPKSATADAFGGIIKTNLAKKIHWVVVSIFADYLLQSTTAKNSTGKTKVDLSGLSVGVGIGGCY